MFDSIFKNETSAGLIALMALAALISGFIYSYINSFKIRASKGVFITMSIMPLLVSLGVSVMAMFLTDSSSANIARIATIGIALGLIRFRSVNGTAEEILLLLGTVISGFIFGLGYIAYGAIAMLLISLLFVLLSTAPIFKNKRFSKEKLLKITIPESLNYTDIFNETFNHYLKENEIVEVKTTGMGSMFKLSYRVVLKNPLEEKELIDEIRIKNGNLEITIMPYVDPSKSL